ncbi:efflux RND transporter periplasmic adaptor subunit [Siccirubricoccus deserti]|uniref:Efflux RND transporter periplasmic adaptor subunit n=1 Tax=Siccirubricoccus deserti TaxID=2013562 RepID=A0A9X0QVK1_9PROT|nr:efflux RND transporter periplasmic adaptor subunit [Siccirubricoccus deserti]MBC4014729.1 efflux RND transporter periplasmic adaptor subunit [Siccirubricoccus deserti]
MRRRLMPLLSPALIAAMLALLSATAALAQQAGGGVPVTTDTVQQGAVPIEILANGIVASESVVTVRTRVDGQITQVHVTEGQMVRRGQPLFSLDARLNQAILAQQEAQLARDRAQAARTAADAQRYQSLRGESFASQQRFEQAQADALAAAATVRATEALIAQTRLQVEFATITAEIDGRLGALPLRVGNFVRQAESTAITTLTQMDPILVQFAVPERWLPEIRAAVRRSSARVQVRAEQDDAPAPEGELIFVDSAVDTTTGTILLKARFANADAQLWPGQYVQVTLTPRSQEDAMTVATAAVQTGQQGRFVFVLTADSTARRRSVTLERTLGNRAVVRGEIQPGEKVIVDGAQRVTDGTRAVERNAPPNVPATAQRVSAAR